MRTYHDRFSGQDFRVPSRGELLARKNLDALRALGVDPLDVHCCCCGLRLTDLRRIKVTVDGAIGPECSKPGHVYPCRNVKTDVRPLGKLVELADLPKWTILASTNRCRPEA